MYTILCVELDLKREREREREIRKIKFWYGKLPYLEYHKDIDLEFQTSSIFISNSLDISKFLIGLPIMRL